MKNPLFHALIAAIVFVSAGFAAVAGYKYPFLDEAHRPTSELRFSGPYGLDLQFCEHDILTQPQ